jgi:hypothetical protein
VASDGNGAQKTDKMTNVLNKKCIANLLVEEYFFTPLPVTSGSVEPASYRNATSAALAIRFVATCRTM